MSRIEKALEKATKLRQETNVAGAEGKPLIDKAVTDGDMGEISPYAVTLSEPGSPVAEEYRKLKSMVVKLTKQGGFRNTIMITSVMGGEGKSVTALNLAITLAQDYDHTVLLIDADLRSPSLHKHLDVSPETGLADCLLDGLDVSEVLLRTGLPNLSFLPSGRRVKNPVELFGSQRMRELLKDMKHRYSDRYVIIDTPPTLLFAETHTISSLVDGTVLVVKEDGASIESIGEVLDILKDGNVLGIVFNDVSVENLDGRYHYYYHYGGYGNNNKETGG